MRERENERYIERVAERTWERERKRETGILTSIKERDICKEFERQRLRQILPNISMHDKIIHNLVILEEEPKMSGLGRVE